jgi:hypothetical protein
MVGSTYIYLKRRGRRSLLNTAQVAYIYTNDINLASETSKLEYGNRYPLEQGTIYTIQFMMTCGRETEDIYARADERDEMYNQIVAALAPTVVIESFAPFMPEVPEEPKQERNSSYPDDLFDSQEEYALAIANVIDRMRQEKAQAAAQQSVPAPPTHKLLRKPRTPRQ